MWIQGGRTCCSTVFSACMWLLEILFPFVTSISETHPFGRHVGQLDAISSSWAFFRMNAMLSCWTNICSWYMLLSTLLLLHKEIQPHQGPHHIFKPWGGEIGNFMQCNWPSLLFLAMARRRHELTSWGVSASFRAGLCQRTFIHTFPWRCGARLDWNQHADHHPLSPLSLIDKKCQSTHKCR